MEQLGCRDRRNRNRFFAILYELTFYIQFVAFPRDQHARIDQDSHGDSGTASRCFVASARTSQYPESAFGKELSKPNKSAALNRNGLTCDISQTGSPPRSITNDSPRYEMRSSNSEKLRAAAVAEMLRFPFAWDGRSPRCVLARLGPRFLFPLARRIKSDYLIHGEIVNPDRPERKFNRF
jgi:hypothetical protein